MKFVLAAEREKTKQERERRKEANVTMDVDGQPYDEEEMPTCMCRSAPVGFLSKFCELLVYRHVDRSAPFRFAAKALL